MNSVSFRYLNAKLDFLSVIKSCFFFPKDLIKNQNSLKLYLNIFFLELFSTQLVFAKNLIFYYGNPPPLGSNSE